MKEAYPIVLTQDGDWYVVFVPDFEIGTQGKGLAEAMEMARDAISLAGNVLEDEGREVPRPSPLQAVTKENDADLVTLVDVDFEEYRKANDMRTVRRNVSLPQWLNVRAEKSGINVSAVLQKALKAELNIV